MSIKHLFFVHCVHGLKEIGAKDEINALSNRKICKFRRHWANSVEYFFVIIIIFQSFSFVMREHQKEKH